VLIGQLSTMIRGDADSAAPWAGWPAADTHAVSARSRAGVSVQSVRRAGARHCRGNRELLLPQPCVSGQRRLATPPRWWRQSRLCSPS